MADLSVRDISSGCLGREPRSLLRDVFGVYGVNSEGTRIRSLRQQLTRIRDLPFVRVVCVTIQPPGSPGVQYVNQQRDLDRANDTYEQRCSVWIYCAAAQVARTSILGSNGMLDQTDCNAGGPLDFLGINDHEVSLEELQLFTFGRNVGANIVCYFLPGGSTSTGPSGCAAHPDGRRGFWVKFGSGHWVFAHELGHIVGNLQHTNVKSNLMLHKTGEITSTPPQLTQFQCAGFPPRFPGGVKNDPDMERC